RAAVKVVSLDGALEALALRAAADLHALALLECADRDLLADLRIALVTLVEPELGQVLEGRRTRFLQVAEPRLGEPPLLGLAERQLHGAIAVAVGLADSRDPARARLDHGGRDPLALLGEELSHADLASEDARHRASPTA